LSVNPHLNSVIQKLLTEIRCEFPPKVRQLSTVNQFPSILLRRRFHNHLVHLFVSGNNNSPAIMAAVALMPKKSALLSKLSQKPAMIPAIFAPREVVMNQPPIIRAVNRRGETLDTRDKPTGLTNSSLIVIHRNCRQSRQTKPYCGKYWLIKRQSP